MRKYTRRILYALALVCCFALSAKSTVAGLAEQEPKSLLMHGNLFMFGSCPFTVAGAAEALERRNSKSMSGNYINVQDNGLGRTGNRFMVVSAYLAMGFCCRSRLLSLPETDAILPSAHEGLPFSAENPWFDFRDAIIPWDEYKELGADKRVCRPETVETRREVAHYDVHVHPRLLGCMNRVKLRGCEVAYLGSLMDKGRFCPSREPREGEARAGAGSLVLHVRSGDIFDQKGPGRLYTHAGQPPLEFYLLAIASQKWDDITILTAASQPQFLNPSYSTLEIMAKSGVLGSNVQFFKNRPLLDDIQTMLCADALAMSRTSLSFLTFGHTRATRFFIPSECGNGHFRLGERSRKYTYDNATLLALEKPEGEVYGIVWGDEGAADYSVYKAWHGTLSQLMEMVTYGHIKGLQKCNAPGGK